MKATHILLGRPYKYDRKVTHDRATNRIEDYPQAFVTKRDERILGKNKVGEGKRKKNERGEKKEKNMME
ncbi:hypothetical protein CR513_37826, partial [Mucuna pruriens]